MNMSLENKLHHIISLFDPIGLDQMESVRLMRRTDTKFVFPVKHLDELLHAVIDNYYIVEIENEREQIYKTTYFDTDDYVMYHMHHNGKQNRHKVRIRKYIYSDQEFLEVKRKNNKGETIKNRIERKESHNINTCSSSKKFIGSYSPYNSEFLTPTLGNNFIRVTLVNKNFKERITLDYKIKFTDLKYKSQRINNDTCIAEIKTDRDTRAQSPFLQKLNNMRIKSMGFSKYCMGLALLNPEVKNNIFKQKLRTLAK
ncbi:MAG: polyphosphate polymerase domain-containing protein [Prolixibacteraceae bacterium]|nr:polyphosphate polymerase domain-containing protein [Prolixibacteraceae bacterium]